MTDRRTTQSTRMRANTDLRIVFVGRTGAGKSATGNTILGRDVFESELSPTSITEECSWSRGTVCGQKVMVVDTPGLFDTKYDPEVTCQVIGECIVQSAPGPHAFLIVIRLDRFTNEEKQAVETIQKMFGEAADAYSMVVFTRGDELKGTIEDFLGKSSDLMELVERCNKRYHVLNNKEKGGRQVEELLQKIRRMVNDNGGSHYTNQMYQQAERDIQAKQESILRERAQEIHQQKEQLKREVEAEFDKKLKKITDQMEASRKKEKAEMEQERKKMAEAMDNMQRQGKQYIEESVQTVLQRENMQVKRARDRVEDHNHIVGYNQQMAQMSVMMAQQMQLSEQRQQLALERQRVEMERAWNQKEETRRQQDQARWDRLERERQEVEKEKQRESRRRVEELEARERERAREEAVEDKSLVCTTVNLFKSGWKKFTGFFGL